MSLTVYHTLAAYTATASAEATGYEDDNLSLRSVRRSWRSNALSNSPWTIVFNLGSALATTGILVWDTNILADGIAVHHSPDNSNWTALGSTVTITTNIAGRRAAIIPTGITKQYWRLTITSATTTDGADYAEIGRVVVTTASTTIPGESWPLQVNVQRPQASADLMNGRRPVASTGESYAEISLPSKYLLTTENPHTAVDWARLGPIVVNFGTLFGVALLEDVSDNSSRSYDNVYVGNFEYTFREVV